MRVVGAVAIASTIPLLVLGAAGVITMTSSIVIAVTAVVIGFIIIVADAL